MKHLIRKAKGIVRGAPTGVLISIGIHAALFFIAGVVALSVAVKKEKKFVPPPPIERKKMTLRKTRVKVNKNVKPKSTRIMAKSATAISDIQLPEMSPGVGGLGGGVGGFELMPDLAEMSLFGSTKSIAVGNDFEGTFYSLALNRMMQETNIDRDGSYELAKRFIEKDWNPNVFAPYFRAPEKLYTTHFVLPPDLAITGPDSFGYDDPNFPPEHWLVHYKGKVASPKDGRFRFWGAGDDMFIIRMNGEIVLDASWSDKTGFASGWFPTAPEHQQYYMGNTSAKVGDWFELKANEPVEMEVILYKNNPGVTNHILAVEDEDEEYDKNRQGMPVLPAFKTAEFPEAIRTEIEYLMIRDEIDLHSGLMFNVH